MATILTIEFIIFSIAGWFINTGYSSWKEKRFCDPSFFHVPFCPVYGLGGIVLVIVLKYLRSLSFSAFLIILLATLAMIIVEYFGGKFNEVVFKIKLWDYSKAKYNLGYIDAFHSFCWLILVGVFYFFVYNYIIKFESSLVVPAYLNWPIFFLFLFVLSYFAIIKYPSSFLDIQNQVINLTVMEYKHVVRDIRRYRRAKNAKVRKMLDEKIHRQLIKTGLKMKKRG